MGSAGASRGAGWGDALPGVCGGSGKPVGYGPAVPRRGEQKQGTGRRQDFPFFADRMKNAYFPAAVASLPLPPAPRPALIPDLLRSPRLSLKDGRKGWVKGCRTGKGKGCGLREPGVTEQGGRQCLGKGPSRRVSSRQLSSQRLRPTPRAMRPQEVPSRPGGERSETNLSAAGNPGLPKLR